MTRSQSGHVTDVARVLRLVTRRLAGAPTRLVGVRERDMARAVTGALEEVLDCEVRSRVLPVASWPSLGRSAVDVVASDGDDRPLVVAELKWSQRAADKVWEVLWDLFKLALIAGEHPSADPLLITAAPTGVWPHACCGDVFDGGTFSVEELCARRFAIGARRLVWDELIGGGYERCPLRLPAEIETIVAGMTTVADESGEWSLRAVRVKSADRLVDVVDGWPCGGRPADARYPRRAHREASSEQARGGLRGNAA